MKKVRYSLALALILVVLSSCKYVSKFAESATGMPMDGESTYTKAAELLAEVDPAWKVYTFWISNDGMADECKNTLGCVSVGMMNADGEVYSQNIYPFKSDPKIDSFAPKDATFDGIPAIGFSAEKAMKQVNECKAKIPEGYKFLNLEKYKMKYDVKAAGFITEIVINVQEVGKESVDVNGKKSSLYYQLSFTINPDGKMEMKES